MRIPFIAWIFQGIPECIGIAALILSLEGTPFNWRTIGLIGFLQAVIAYVVRLLPFTPGAHVFLLPISLALLASFFVQIRLDKALIYAVIITVFITCWEILMHLIVGFLGIGTLQEINTDNLLRIIVSTPQVIMLFITAFYLQRKRGVAISETNEDVQKGINKKPA